MRAALCLSGMSRTFREAFPSIKEHILDRYRPDVFLSTWKSVLPDPLWPDGDRVEDIVDLYRPVKFDIELFDEKRMRSFETNSFRSRADWGGDAVHRIIPMYYRIFLANLHKLIHERENQFTYDVVIRCRPDLRFGKPVELMEPIENDTVYMPHGTGGTPINDQFWYSNSATADRLASLYMGIPQLWHSGFMIHGETLLGGYLSHLQLNVRIVEASYEILRGNPGAAWELVKQLEAERTAREKKRNE